ncbi:MAG TPA: CAP domain-containing protein, partial [Candidatus Angelobacter sp.]|nr:CAP domain-containing protein [Candidatus Angelobacter sp.]
QLSHLLPGEMDMGERVAATGLRFDAVAENVAYAPTVESAHQGLMNSPPHRTNIMNPQYDAVGMAVIFSGRELYVAQNFAHALPAFTETQFRDTMLLAFNQARRSKGLDEMKVVFDQRLQQAACSTQPDPKSLISELPGAANVDVFTSPSPIKLPEHMQLSAADSKLHRMNVGVCFKSEKEHGFASFTVVAAFFRTN